MEFSPTKCNMETLQCEEKKDIRLVPARYVLATLGFAACVVQYTLNVCLSVAIVAMVKPVHTPTQHTVHFKTDENQTWSDFHSEVIVACPSTIPNGSFAYNIHNESGEFPWDEETQGHVLAAYYYGYVATQLIGGRLSETFGAKMVCGPGILFSGIFTLLVPVAVRTHFYAFIAIRVLTGAASGVTIPALHVMFANWFPPNERAKISGLIFSATNVGSLLSMSLSGVVAKYGGWSLVFYFFGTVTVVWYIPWALFAFNSPQQHPRISEEEKRYIISQLGSSEDKVSVPVPWRDILSTWAVWAAIGMTCSMTWITFTLLTELPTYTKNILHFDIAESGLVSSLPYLSTWISSILCGFLSQWLRAKGYVSHLGAYRIFNGIASCGPALSLLTITLVGCNSTAIVALLIVTMATRGAFFGGSYINHIDLGHNYAGTISGIMLTFANSAGIISPLVTGFLTKDQQTLQQWRYVFYISIGMVTVPYIMYLICGSTKEQSWNKPKENNKAHMNKTTSVTHM